MTAPLSAGAASATRRWRRRAARAPRRGGRRAGRTPGPGAAGPAPRWPARRRPTAHPAAPSLGQVVPAGDGRRRPGRGQRREAARRGSPRGADVPAVRPGGRPTGRRPARPSKPQSSQRISTNVRCLTSSSGRPAGGEARCCAGSSSSRPSSLRQQDRRGSSRGSGPGPRCGRPPAASAPGRDAHEPLPTGSAGRSRRWSSRRAPRPTRRNAASPISASSGSSTPALEQLRRGHQVVGLLGDRHEVEAERAGGRQDAQAGVGPAGGDGGRDGEVGALLAAVALDVDRVEPVPGELVVEQHPGAGAALPVDVAHAGPGQVVDAGEPERVARRDDQPLLPVHQPDHRARAGAEHPVEVRQRVLAGGRVQQVRAGEVAQPVAAARPGRPASRRWTTPGVSRGSRSRSARRGQVEHQVVRPDRHDRASDLVQPAQQLDLDLARRRGDPPGRRGRRSRPSARTSEVSTPAPRGSGVATTCPPTRPSRTRTQSSMPTGRGELAGEPRRAWSAAGPARCPRARPAAGRRRCRTSARPTPGSRVRPITGVASTTPSTTGCPGRTATPCTASTPSSATTCAVQSSRPALEPASTITRSLTAAAAVHGRGDQRSAGPARSA